MGTQGEIYVVYGLQVEAKVLYARGGYRNPVVYGVNGRAFSDDEDKTPVLERLTHLSMGYAGIQTNGYGALDPAEQELSVRPMGHSGEHGGNMGARHFVEGHHANQTGEAGKALVGYAVCNASYWNSAEPCASMEQIKAVAPKLIADISKKLGLDVKESDLGLHLMFDWLQGY